ncbi:arginase family protein [Dyella flava]|uniref:Arginase family protein n=1 Tax=Dyella flava TaxID=1920170 RepID=A0ABS2K9I2_9GAMM|nr:arginase family protein [Dyella flava]MBM7127700.1 arginase family protein [Dyella flava]GLQ51299.1 arginase [Dyella flava]
MVPTRRLAVLEAPSNLGLKPPLPAVEPGVKYMAHVLREHGVLTRLQAEDAGVVVPPAYAEAIDPVTRVRNARQIRHYSMELADRIAVLLEQGNFPIVTGGDCSVLLGSALALRRRGRHGLLFIDGHTDLMTPEHSQTGGLAGMDLACATGAGPDLLADIDACKPYIQPSDVVVFGYRWPAPDEVSVATPTASMHAMPLHRIREQGVAESAHAAIKQLESLAEGFWIHLDLDVLAPEWMPAVDSPDPGGMDPDELHTVLKIVLASPRCVGMEVTIYDPTLDPDEKLADFIIDLLASVWP